MRTRRSSFNIAIAILERCRIPARSTHIVYGVNINFKLFQEYAIDLIREGLLTKEGDLWKTTGKGLNMLGHAREITLTAPCLAP